MIPRDEHRRRRKRKRTSRCHSTLCMSTPKRVVRCSFFRGEFALVYFTVVGTFFGLVLLAFFITFTCDAGRTTDFWGNLPRKTEGHPSENETLIEVELFFNAWIRRGFFTQPSGPVRWSRHGSSPSGIFMWHNGHRLVFGLVSWHSFSLIWTS